MYFLVLLLRRRVVSFQTDPIATHVAIGPIEIYSALSGSRCHFLAIYGAISANRLGGVADFSSEGSLSLVSLYKTTGEVSVFGA